MIDKTLMLFPPRSRPLRASCVNRRSPRPDQAITCCSQKQLHTLIMEWAKARPREQQQTLEVSGTFWLQASLELFCLFCVLVIRLTCRCTFMRLPSCCCAQRDHALQSHAHECVTKPGYKANMEQDAFSGRGSASCKRCFIKDLEMSSVLFLLPSHNTL